VKILYATDVHGQKWKYERILDSIQDHDVLIIGADILPKRTGHDYFHQTQFITSFLPRFFDELEIPLIIDFGNDDLMNLYSHFKKIVDERDNVFYSHLSEVVIDDVSFIGMHFVPDYPFTRKDWCRRDGERVADVEQFGPPWWESSAEGDIPIDDLDLWLRSKPSIGEYISDLPKPSCDKVVYLMHAPPRMAGLDVCADGRQVGSVDITDFIIKHKPMISLHGHIHENFIKTGVFMTSLADGSLSIQPGQIGGGGWEKMVYCSFELENVRGTIVRTELRG